VAATVHARRVDAPRPLRHGGPSRPATKSTPRAASRPTGKPDLRLVPKPRVALNAALVLGFVVVVLMLGTVVLHTRLSERQVEIDRLETAVTEARARFDVLRQQRAELRSPMRLSIEAADLGMRQAPRSEFMAVDPQTLAETLAAAGVVDEITGTITTDDPLEQIRRVKAADGGAG
jgi:hypothetical protein